MRGVEKDVIKWNRMDRIEQERVLMRSFVCLN